MKATRWGKPRPWELAAYLDGELGASDTAAVQRYLEGSSDARRQFEQLSDIRSALSTSGQEFEAVDLLPSIRARIREHTRVLQRPSDGPLARLFQKPRAVLFAASLLTVGVCLGLAFMPHAQSARDFRAKSASQTPNSARWAGVQAYRVRAGKPERLGETMSASDGLLFSYTNVGREPLSNLMIFAVDSGGEVHWFHPAYEREGMNPASIAIEKGAAEVPLSELVQDEFPKGPLTIHALFSNRPLLVLEVEAWLKRGARASMALHVPGGVDHVLNVRIEQ